MMISSRPYLIRAAYEWITDNGYTPHMLVDTNFPGVVVPQEYVSDGRIILNVSPTAVQGLDLGNEAIQFRARFSGKARLVTLPPASVLGVYANENHELQIFFPEEQAQPTTSEKDDHPAEGPPGGPKKPTLKVIK